MGWGISFSKFYVLFVFSIIFLNRNFASASDIVWQSYSLPPFETSGFRQDDPEIKKYYEVELGGKLKVAQTQTDFYNIIYKSDGLKIKGFALFPKIAAEVLPGSLPLIIFNRGGNVNFGEIDIKDLLWLSNFSRKGFVILASQYRETAGSEGQDQFGGEDVDDVLNLQKIAMRLPMVNKNKIYMMGHSRGGMMTYEALRNNSSVKAAVILAGECDLEKGLEERPDFVTVYRKLIPHFDENRKLELTKRSACSWANEITTPLFIHGDSDSAVNVAQAREMASALDASNKPYKLEIAPGESHVFFFFDSVVNHLVTEIIQWFNQF